MKTNPYPQSTSIQSSSSLVRAGVRITILLFLFTSLHTHSQSWQWGKRGGSIDQLDTTGDGRQEEVYSIVTDSDKNIYTLSYVGINNLNVDGNPKTNYGDPTTKTDVCLSSFACDGTYRWSKIFWGGGRDQLQPIQIDSQNNIYVAGKFGDCGDTTYPPRIDDDVILSQSPQDCSVVFIAKFNNNGVMQWFKRPEVAGTSFNQGMGQSFSKGLSTDSAGNSYWLTSLPPGSYCEGSFTPTLSGTNFYVLKYDANGNYVSSIYLDFQVTIGALTNLQFVRNPYNGYFYITSSKDYTTDTAVVGGQTITNSAFIGCFNTLGQFQWVRQNTYSSPGGLSFYNLAFDPQNNIYIGGKFLGFGLDSFIGLTMPESLVTGFIMKVNSNADTKLWGSYNNKDNDDYGAILVNGNEVAFTNYCYGTDFTWGSQVLNVNSPNQGVKVLLARFNATTGACIGLSCIANDLLTNDRGTALAVDASGDYILGGGFGHQLSFTTNSILNIGQQSDFFVAKYSTSVCSLSNKDFKEQGMELAPNPVESMVKVETQEDLNYSLYDITGKLIKQGKITQQENSIDFAQLMAGTYILETTNQEGAVKKVKLLKK